VAGDASLCAVLKADAYGHGAVTAAHAALAGGADSFAVAVIDEGIELREAGFTSPILVLAEVAASTIPDALANDLTLTIGSLEGAKAAVAVAEEKGGMHRVHVKVDTGMHRMGVAPESLNDVIDTLSSSISIDLEGLFSHFAVAEGTSAEDRAFTESQIERFDGVVSALKSRGTLPRVLHLANSAGTLGYPNARHSMVRPGLSIYGYLPERWLARALEEKGEHLETALTLRTRVVAVRRVSAGDRPSYGRRRALERDSTVVTLPIGYADGYPRALFAGGAEVLISGRRYPLAGNVTMDQLVVDVEDDNVTLGDDVVLLGRDGDEVITADDWAEWGNTISWEILGRVGARVPRVVLD
jgi:alanine racemase